MTNTQKPSRADLQIGLEYDVRFNDCCVEGTFRAKFLGWQYDQKLVSEYREDDYPDQHWSNGVIFQNSAAVTYVLAEPAPGNNTFDLGHEELQ